jgi:hypothetical protein
MRVTINLVRCNNAHLGDFAASCHVSAHPRPVDPEARSKRIALTRLFVGKVFNEVNSPEQYPLRRENTDNDPSENHSTGQARTSLKRMRRY